MALPEGSRPGPSNERNNRERAPSHEGLDLESRQGQATIPKGESARTSNTREGERLPANKDKLTCPVTDLFDP